VKKIMHLVLTLSLALSLTNTVEARTGQNDLAVFKSVQVQKGDSTLEVTLEIQGEYSYQHFELGEPPRLVVEFSPVGEIHTETIQEIYTAGVKNIRTGRFQPQTARVVFDMAEVLPSYEITQVENGIQVKFQAQEDMPAQPEALPEKDESAPAISEKEPATHLKDINYKKTGNEMHVSIVIDGDFSYKTVELVKYSLLAVDIQPIQILSANPVPAINQMGLKEIGVSRVGTETVRLTFAFDRWISDFRIERVPAGILVKFPFTETPEAVKKKKEVKKDVKVYETFGNTVFAISLFCYKISDELFQEIYGGTAPLYGLELSRNIFRTGNFRFDLGFAGRMYSRTGASTVTAEETKFRLTPITFAARLFFNTKYVAPYIGGGIDIHKYKEESMLGTISGSTTGSHFQAGLYLKVPQVKFLMLNLYVKLYNATATKEDVSIDLGGTEFGVAICLGFDVLKKAVLILN